MSNNNLCILKSSAHANCLIFIGFETQSLYEARIINSHIKLTSNLMILIYIKKIPSFRANGNSNSKEIIAKNNT